jgi:quercetin dioxygenase-like cupin family protein
MAAAANPNEASLREAWTREGLTVSRWSNGPRAVYAIHDHAYRKRLVVLSGQITFTVEGPRRVVLTLTAGDRLDIPPRTAHSARVGPKGVVCLEGQGPPASA